MHPIIQYGAVQARTSRHSLAVQDEGSRAGEPGDEKIFGEGSGWRAADSADGFLVAGPLGALGGGLLGWLLTGCEEAIAEEVTRSEVPVAGGPRERWRVGRAAPINHFSGGRAPDKPAVCCQ